MVGCQENLPGQKQLSLLNIIGQPHKLARTHVRNVEGLLGVLLWKFFENQNMVNKSCDKLESSSIGSPNKSLLWNGLRPDTRLCEVIA